ncbi:MAG: hypothetical protein GQ470_04975, partial [Gammaproteobacteria bacterium]|nr:hypothetical protein [Gammaproteobacteria bacterium]
AAIDEGKATVFVIELSEVRAVDTLLTLASGGDATSGVDYTAQMQFREQNADSTYSAWTDVVSGQVTISTGLVKVEVKVVTLSDATVNETESLTLTATIDTAIDAAADVANLAATGTTTINDSPSLYVSAPSYVSEGNIAYFDVGLSSIKDDGGTSVTISFEGVAVLGTDFTYSIDGGTTWISDASSTITIVGDADFAQAFSVQVQTTSDVSSEFDELLTLVATTADTGVANSSTDVSGSTYIIDPVSLTTNEDAAVTMSDGVDYTYSLLGQPNNGTVVDDGSGTLTYTPTTHYAGTDSFTYTRTDTGTGSTTTGIATVTVTAVADVPTLSISVSEPVDDNVAFTDHITNGEFEALIEDTTTTPVQGTATGGLNDWIIKYTTGTTTYAELSGALGDRSIELNHNNKNLEISQTVTTLTTATDYTLTFDYSDPDTAGATDASMEVYWNDALIGTVSGTGSAEFTILQANVLADGTDAIRFVEVGTKNDTNESGIHLDSVSLFDASVIQTYTYNVDVDVALVDTDGSESLQNILITSSDLATGGILNLADGTVVTDDDATTGYSGSVAESDLAGLTLTVEQPAVEGSFNLTATATSIEASNSVTAISTSSVAVTMPTAAVNSVPSINSSEVILSNEASYTGTTTTIATTFGDGTNTFSWDESGSTLPDIYVGGELVTITYDDVAGTVTGTTSAGDTVFTVTVTMGEPNTTLEYVQNTDLLSSKIDVAGDIVLPGGGNYADGVVLGFEDLSGNIQLDAVLTSENTLDGTIDNTVNSSSYYVGVDSNNMNPGDKLTMDFATAGTAYPDGTGTSSANEVAELKISLFNFDSESNSAPDELIITYTTSDGVDHTVNITNADLDADGFYTISDSGGLSMTTIVFEAGSSSSFKLGIESISSITTDVDFDMQLAYSIADGDGDSASGLVTITLDGDDSIIYNSADAVIDGGSGTDTLIIPASETLDFSLINNIEKIDLEQGSADSLSITYDDVLGSTDAANQLTILGEAADSVTLDNSVQTWTDTGTTVNDADGIHTYNVYTSTDGVTAVTLWVDQDVTVGII